MAQPSLAQDVDRRVDGDSTAAQKIQLRWIGCGMSALVLLHPFPTHIDETCAAERVAQRRVAPATDPMLEPVVRTPTDVDFGADVDVRAGGETDRVSGRNQELIASPSSRSPSQHTNVEQPSLAEAIADSLLVTLLWDTVGVGVENDDEGDGKESEVLHRRERKTTKGEVAWYVWTVGSQWERGWRGLIQSSLGLCL